MGNKYSKPLLLIIAFLILTLTTIASYAYFTASVAGNNNAQDNVITTGNMTLILTDGQQITLEDAIPTSSITKTFKVKNTGTLTTTYDVYLSEIINTFVDKNDLVYTLTSATGCPNATETAVPSVVGEQSKIVSSCSINANVEHEYTLTITFKDDGTNQDDNKGKKFSAKITINEYSGFSMISQLIEKKSAGATDLEYDGVDTLGENGTPDNNLRYVGTNPNNYIYFNCSTTNPSEMNDSTCEKWRILGVFNNIEDNNGNVSSRIKIMKYEPLGKYMWDNSVYNDSDGMNQWGASVFDGYKIYNYYSNEFEDGDSQIKTEAQCNEYNETNLYYEIRAKKDNTQLNMYDGHSETECNNILNKYSVPHNGYLDHEVVLSLEECNQIYGDECFQIKEQATCVKSETECIKVQEPYEGSILMRELNTDYLGNITVGTDGKWFGKFNNEYNRKVDMPTSQLNSNAQEMIQEIKWEIGASSYEGSSKEAYHDERNGVVSKQCDTEHYSCCDSIVRTTSWIGKVGLVYVSDIAYSLNSNLTDKADCINRNWYDDEDKCWSKSWILSGNGMHTLTPVKETASQIYGEHSFGGDLFANGAEEADWIYPVVHLKNNVVIDSGEGTSANPYKLTM